MKQRGIDQSPVEVKDDLQGGDLLDGDHGLVATLVVRIAATKGIDVGTQASPWARLARNRA